MEAVVPESHIISPLDNPHEKGRRTCGAAAKFREDVHRIHKGLGGVQAKRLAV
jgi:hypothetical protein